MARERSKPRTGTFLSVALRGRIVGRMHELGLKQADMAKALNLSKTSDNSAERAASRIIAGSRCLYQGESKELFEFLGDSIEFECFREYAESGTFNEDTWNMEAVDPLNNLRHGPYRLYNDSCNETYSSLGNDHIRKCELIRDLGSGLEPLLSKYEGTLVIGDLPIEVKDVEDGPTTSYFVRCQQIHRALNETTKQRKFHVSLASKVDELLQKYESADS